MIQLGSMRLFCICAILLSFSTATSVAEKKSARLTLREKRAACRDAFYYLFYRSSSSHYRYEMREARKSGKRTSPIFIEAFDESRREVTPAALITAFRREGFNVYPAWTESKWRHSHDPKRRVDVERISLTKFKSLSDERIQWRVQGWGLVGSDSKWENSLTQSSIELKKQAGRWKVVKWHVDFAAG